MISQTVYIGKIIEKSAFEGDKMGSHSQRVDLLYKDYLFWAWYQNKDETLAFCPDTTITLILLGKEVSELLEDELNFVWLVLYMYYAIIQKPV